jgi:hypothetical protein
MKRHLLYVFSGIMAVLFVLCGAMTACAPAGNTLPVIRALEAPERVMPQFNIPLICNAASYGGTLTYTWTASAGVIQGSGDNVIWITPEKLGVYMVTVEVKDENGNTAKQSKKIEVVGYIEEELAVVSVECVDCQNKTDASKWRSYLVRCNVNVMDWTKLTFDWTSTIGKIEGRGKEATWQTFGQYGNSLIKVVASDPDGKSAEGYLAVNISCCH